MSLLLTTSQVYDYGFSPQRGEGFKVAIHHHMDQPIMALSDVDISPGFVTQLSVTPTLTVTTERAAKRFSPEDRMCYFDDEFRFKYLPPDLYRYSLSNCLFAATHNEIIEKCQCVPFFHTLAYNDVGKVCSGNSLLCMNKILMDIGSHTEVEGKSCYSPCIDQSNRMAVTTSVFPNRNTFTQGDEFCILFHKLKSTCATQKRSTLTNRYPSLCRRIERAPRSFKCFVNQSKLSSEATKTKQIVVGTTDAEDVIRGQHVKLEVADHAGGEDPLTVAMYQYARENLALVNIYIKDPAVTQIKREQKIPLIWFVANVGGILGLTMGCSLVTVFEIALHFGLVIYKTWVKSTKQVKRRLTMSHRKADPDFKQPTSVELVEACDWLVINDVAAANGGKK